jgi:hypothetical protein
MSWLDHLVIKRRFVAAPSSVWRIDADSDALVTDRMVEASSFVIASGDDAVAGIEVTAKLIESQRADRGAGASPWLTSMAIMRWRCHVEALQSIADAIKADEGQGRAGPGLALARFAQLLSNG